MEQVEDKLKEEKERRGKLMETRAILGRETEAAAAQYKNRMERIKYLRSRVSKISAEVERFLNQGKYVRTAL
jgi:chromosome segregation ATPase